MRKGSKVLPDAKQQYGQICETILFEHLLRLGYYIFRPPATQDPVGVTAVNNGGEILLLDARKECRRVKPDGKKADRVYRSRTEAQKRLGARLAYVDMTTGAFISSRR